MYQIWYIYVKVIKMGRYISSGILTEISIKKRKDSWYTDSNFDIKKQIDEILNDINKIIDTSKYDIIEKSDEFILKLDTDFINKNIYDLLVEMNNINHRINFINAIIEDKVDCIDSEFKKKHPITCTFNGDNYIIKCGDMVRYDEIPFSPFYWLLSNKKLFYNVEIYGSMIPIWIDYQKISSDDETFLLMVLNKMKTKYFKSELSKCVIFEVIG